MADLDPAVRGDRRRRALNKQPGDTLSEHVWDWASIKGKGGGWRLRRVGLLMFLAWLVAHFLTGGEF
jgi:hypothetical protein